MRRNILRQLALYRDQREAARDLNRPLRVPHNFQTSALLIPSTSTLR